MCYLFFNNFLIWIVLKVVALIVLCCAIPRFSERYSTTLPKQCVLLKLNIACPTKFWMPKVRNEDMQKSQILHCIDFTRLYYYRMVYFVSAIRHFPHGAATLAMSSRWLWYQDSSGQSVPLLQCLKYVVYFCIQCFHCYVVMFVILFILLLWISFSCFCLFWKKAIKVLVIQNLSLFHGLNTFKKNRSNFHFGVVKGTFITLLLAELVSYWPFAR